MDNNLCLLLSLKRFFNEYIFYFCSLIYMKKLSKYILLASLFLVIFSACNNNSGNLSTDVVSNPNTANGEVKDNLPRIEFEKEIHDFDKVIQGERVSYGFKFKNMGKSDLVVSEVKTSCGCTTPKFPKEPIKPGEERVITVTFDSKGRKGIQNKSVTILSNCQPSTTVVRIKAMVIAP